VSALICAITASDVSGHIAWPAGPNLGETIIRKFIISLATFGALISFAGNSAVTALSQSQFVPAQTSAHHHIKVNDAVRTLHPTQAPLFAS
jgi:hypothetical protein